MTTITVESASPVPPILVDVSLSNSGPPGPPGPVGPIGPTGQTGATGNPGPVAFGLDFAQGATVVNGTIVVVKKAPYPLTINSLDYEVGYNGGSFIVTVQINGVSVTGLTAITVSSVASNHAIATAANTVAVGQTTSFLIASTSGSPTGANLQITGTR